MRLFDLRPAIARDGLFGDVNDAPPGLRHAQAAVLRRQVPLFYLILLINVAAAAFTHLAAAPRVLTCAVPALLFLLCLFRVHYWLRPGSIVTSDRAAAAQMDSLRREVALAGAASLMWSLSLFAFGGAYLHCQVVFFIDVNIFAGMFLLTHLRGAAVLIVGIGILPFTLFLLLTRNPVLGIMGVDTLLVCAVLVVVALRNYDDFAALIVSQGELTARQRETQRLSDDNLRLAYLDSLSTLPNRRKFFLELDGKLAAAAASGSRLAVALLDLDRFKMINDLHGHAAGDRLLTQVAARLKRLTGETIFISRLGGDEFGAIITGAGDDAGIVAFGAQVREALQAPCVVGDQLSMITGSIGGAIYPDAGDTGEELFERADYALYYGKQMAKGGLVLFSQEFETSIRRAGLLEQTLRAADLEAEFSLMFQPVVDVAQGRIVAFEALARWLSPTLGRIPPDQFIAVAERTQTISQLTIVLFAKALDAAQVWPADISLCFNLSAHDLINIATMQAIHRLVASQRVSPARIEFEVTETALLADYELAAQALEALHKIGVRVSLDDFGTGFSSLGYVHRLPLDKIKIDRSFVADVDASLTAPSIIKTIVDLCRNLGFACVVEGVETESQLVILKTLGCRLIQGYHFSRPVNENAAIDLIERFNSTIEQINEPSAAVRR
jgi:diguanylate cyclase (GGDEF)-like protein